MTVITDRFRPESAPPAAEDDPCRWTDEDAYRWTDDDLDAVGLHAPDTLEHILEIDAVMAGFAAQRAVSVHRLWREAIGRPRGPRATREIVDRSVRLELATALRITENAAGMLLARSRALVESYPGLLDALAAGRVTERHADVFVDAMDEVDPEVRGRIAERALELAQAEPLGAFRRSLRRLIDTARSVSLADRHEEALRGRRVVREPAQDGMAWLSLYIPAVEAQAVLDRATAMAKVLAAADGETRTLDQLRADVVSDLLIDGEVPAHPEAVRGIRPRVAVTVPALSLLDDRAAADAPAIVEGLGPIAIERARELCGAAAGWMRVLTHPETGVVLSVGREQYQPPPALRRLVRWRSGRCMAPGCGRSPDRCEIDHTIAWEDGGETAAWNLAPLCTGHHTIKHHGNWAVQQLPGGVLEWRSPTGRRYLVEPERRMPSFVPDAGRASASTSGPRPGEAPPF